LRVLASLFLRETLNKSPAAEQQSFSLIREVLKAENT